MGEYYEYVNIDRRERFSVGLYADGIKRFALGRTLGSRAFHLLLLGTTEDTRGAERVGSWMGDRVGVIGDHVNQPEAFEIESAFDDSSERPLSELVHERCRDLASAALVMLIRHDGAGQYAERARESDHLFVALAEIVQRYQQSDIRYLLDTHFDEWRARHSRLVQERWTDVPPP